MTTIATIGEIAGRPVREVHLGPQDSVHLTLMTYGARLTQLWIPDRDGTMADVALGHDRLTDYQANHGYPGATCGRYGNRIAGGRFVLDGQDVQLDRNEGPHHLHGGSAGFDSAVWDIASHSDTHVTFAMTSPDGDMGFPGTLAACCTYRLDRDQRLWVEMTATTTAPTVVNLVQHAYFNLAGQGAGDVLGQELRLHAAHYTPVDAALIPTGEIRAVQGSAYDFALTRRIGASLPDPMGFDTNFCLSAPLQLTNGQLLRPAAQARDPASGRGLGLWTNQVGVQLYTGAHFNDTPGKSGARYGRFAGFALETQTFPDSPNRPQFPSARLDPGQVYRHLMLYDFTPVAGPA
jgi:aldose 1-epimerase